MSVELPGSWEILDVDVEGALPAYHAPAQDPAPYAKVYNTPYDDDYNYVAIVYPRGTDLKEHNELEWTQTLEDAENAIIEWINEYENETPQCDPAK